MDDPLRDEENGEEEVFSRPDDWERYAHVSSDVEALDTYTERVAYLLNRIPEARNSDTRLWLKYLKQFHEMDPTSTKLEAVGSGEVPAQTTVARARAKLQNQYRLYLPTRPEVVIRRQGREKAFRRVFQNLDDLDESMLQESSLYSDESGVTEEYLIQGFVIFVSGRDTFEFNRMVMERFPVESKRAYFHFKDLRASHQRIYQEFFNIGMSLPSVRVYVHIFKNSELAGPQVEVLSRSYEVSAVRTLGMLRREGIIDEDHRITLIPDKSQDALFYGDLANRIEPQLQTRNISFMGLDPGGSKGSYPIQLADIVTSSFGRALNAPSDKPKDELARYVLDHWGVEDLLATANHGNLAVINHGGDLGAAR